MAKFKTENLVGIFVIITLGVFIYITLKIGALRFDLGNYRTYYVAFVSSSGLNRKDEVKIAGVKVGWIEEISLIKQKKYHVRANIKILKDCVLHRDAYAILGQDGIIGRKYLEIVPGTPTFDVLKPGSDIICKEDPTASIDKLFSEAQNITSDIGEVTSAIKRSVSAKDWGDFMQKTFGQLSIVATNLSNLTKSMDILIKENRKNINTATKELSEVIVSLKGEIPKISDNFNKVSEAYIKAAPELEDSFRKASESIDKNLTRAINKFEKISEKLSSNLANEVSPAIQNASTSLDTHLGRVADKFEKAGEQIESVAKKINEGQGTLGKLINEEQIYKDVDVTVKCISDTVSSLSKVCLGFNAEAEGLERLNKKKGDFTKKYLTDYKFYLNGYLHPTPDTLFLTGLVARSDGKITHKDIFDADSEYTTSKEIREYDKWLWNLQFGKSLGNYIWLRAGFFEGTPGLGIDFLFPFKSDRFKLVSSLEAYDFQGHLRIGDDSTHMRWINRMFLNRYLYFTLGLDDFISKYNKSFTFGAGISFDFGGE